MSYVEEEEVVRKIDELGIRRRRRSRRRSSEKD